MSIYIYNVPGLPPKWRVVRRHASLFQQVSLTLVTPLNSKEKLFIYETLLVQSFLPSIDASFDPKIQSLPHHLRQHSFEKRSNNKKAESFVKMATVDACVQKQKEEFILQAPISSSSTHGPESTSTTGTTMSVALVNNTSSSTVYAYISGLASDNNSAVFMLER